MEQAYELVTQYFEIVIKWSILLCEIIGVLIIVLTAIRGVIAWIMKKTDARLIAAEGIAVALTFKLGGEVMRSVIVREWSELLILGAVVLLRAVMAILIHFEIRAEKQLLGDLPVEPKKEKKDRQPIIRL
ncbi:MAG: DUF1622 domain-containing protein [Clostridia bacterium]|nr:DUF1622 domain-containing protein [Clostridia bacterium]